LIETILRRHSTPFHLYDERGIRAGARRLKAAFGWAPAFKEYFAVKATPNPFILKILRQEGFGADCSSAPELRLAERAGITGEEIVFSSNDTPALEFQEARRLGALINLDDLSHLPFLQASAGVPEMLSFRYNPGPLRGGNAIIGRPEEAKFGLTRPQLFEAYASARAMGARRFGLHAMIVSNELNPDCFIDTAELLFDLARELHRQSGVRIELVNLGGGIGVPYRPEQEPVDLSRIGEGVRRLYEDRIAGSPLHPLRLAMENGRLVTGPHGYLVATALHLKETYKRYVGLDACMAHLMRPGMYGAYHHITVLGKEDDPADEFYDVVGSLCENNDKFAIDRPLPRIDRGDLIVLHDAGAHGHAMGFNYNGKLRSAELLLREDGQVIPIRRAETCEDYFATLDFDALDRFEP